MSDELIGKVLNGNFRVERLLGRGGMAQVYYGTDIGLDRPVAIKVIDERWRNDETYTSRFVSEAQVVAQWRHENIVQVYFAGKDDDIYFFVMEYIDGMALDTIMQGYVQSGEFMPHEDVIRIARAIADGLDYGHQKGVIHRDIKPANIMIDREDRAIITDFGLALDVSKGTVGEIFGTPHYIAPEQAVSSANAVAQSDLYALGVILFEMLTGVVPFDDDSITALALQHITKPVPSPRSINPKLNEDTEQVLITALAKEPSDRYQTGAELVNALEQTLIGQATSPPAPAAPPNVKPPSERSMSKMSVSERIAFEMDGRTTPASAPNIPPQPAPPVGAPVQPPLGRDSAKTRLASEPGTVSDSGSNRGMLIMAVVAVVILIVGGIGFALTRGSNDDVEATAAAVADAETERAIAANATLEPSPTVALTDEPATATDEPPTATDAPDTDEPATSTDIPPTATDEPPTATPEPPTETSVPQPPTDAPPTVLYPTGRPLQLFYNDNSLYVWNTSNSRIRSSQLVFEALDANDIPLTVYRFEGNRWSRFYSFIDAGRCVGIEATVGSLLRPPQCGSSYNSVVNDMVEGESLFWLSRGGTVARFRVLWNGSEIARCEIDVDECTFRVPPA